MNPTNLFTEKPTNLFANNLKFACKKKPFSFYKFVYYEPSFIFNLIHILFVQKQYQNKKYVVLYQEKQIFLLL